jgi:hypothetical protein
MTLHIQEMDKMRNELIKAREREGKQQQKRASSPAREADAGPAGESLLPGDVPPKLNPQRGGQGCLNLEDQGLNPWGLNPGGIDYPTGGAGVGHALTYISNIETVCIHDRERAKWTESDERDAAMCAGGMSEEVAESSKTTQASAHQMMWIPKTFSDQMVTSVAGTLLLPEESNCSTRSESDPSAREARVIDCCRCCIRCECASPLGMRNVGVLAGADAFISRARPHARKRIHIQQNAPCLTDAHTNARACSHACCRLGNWKQDKC